MPIEHFVRAEDNLLVIAHLGTIPDEEFRAFYKDLYLREGVDQSLTHLIDLRRANSTPRSTGALRELAEFMQQAMEVSTVAPKVAVVAPESLSYGLARMYDAFAAKAS